MKEISEEARNRYYKEEELDILGITGVSHETLTDDSQVRQAVNDVVYDLFGEAPPCSLEEHQASAPAMQMGGM